MDTINFFSLFFSVIPIIIYLVLLEFISGTNFFVSSFFYLQLSSALFCCLLLTWDYLKNPYIWKNWWLFLEIIFLIFLQIKFVTIISSRRLNNVIDIGSPLCIFLTNNKVRPFPTIALVGSTKEENEYVSSKSRFVI